MSASKEEISDADSDDGFDEDMEALKRACQITGKSPTDKQLQLPSTTGAAASASASSEADSDGEGEEDLQLVRSIQERFADPMDMEDEPLMMKPLCTLPPEWSDSDDCDDDYETLRAIQRRFVAYNDGSKMDNMDDFLHRPVQVGATIIDSEKETSNSFVERTNAREGFLNCVDTSEPTGKKSEACDDAGGTQPSDLVEWSEPGTDDVAGLPLKTSHFPKSALAFVDAIKKNRSCQKLIRSKMMQMEARIEELDKLMERVKILKDFQVACKKRTGRALSQKKDARVQLISVPKLRANIKVNEKKIPAVYKGPPENSHVVYYKEALATFAVNVSREKWSKEERENLVKGVKQQFQGMLLQRSVDLLSHQHTVVSLYPITDSTVLAGGWHMGGRWLEEGMAKEGCCDANGSYDLSNVDSILESIKDIDLTPEKIRLFLPKVNWEELAAMYVSGRSGAECQARFLNFEDPLINHNPWTAMEDKSLLHIVQQKGLSNWIDIAASLGTNRTPFQCLARYQRSLNASILKREWTKEEDNQLRTAVETYGESNWQVVASVMEGRTGTQCSNRWLKTLHPARKRVGKWTAEEDKRLKVAVALFGPKTWKKVARCVPGRTQVQCRERWVNCLDPSLNMAEWTEEEDSKLEVAIAEHGYCWSKVAACIPRRTDNQCWRRWKMLFPNEVPMLQAARKIQKAALISNFVDRESEKPALGPNDFLLPETYRITASENVDTSRRKSRRSRYDVSVTTLGCIVLLFETDIVSLITSRRKEAQEHTDRDALSGETCSEEVPRLTNGNEVENLHGRSMSRKRRVKSSHSIKNNSGPSPSHSSPSPDTVLLDMSNGSDIRESRLNDDSDPAPVAICKEMIVIEPHSMEYEHSDPTEECSLPTLTYPDSQYITTELGGNDVTQSKKASKLHPRRRQCKTLEKSGEDTILKTKKEMKKEKICTDATNDHLSSFPDSMSLMEAIRRIKARKRKTKIQETCSSSDCMSLAVVDQNVNLTPAHAQTITANEDGSVTFLGDKSFSCQLEIEPNQHFRSSADNAVSENLEDSALSSDRDNEVHHEENDVALSETEQSGAEVETSFDGVPNRTKRRRSRDGTCSGWMVEVEQAVSRNDDEAACTSRAIVVEAEDEDTTLSHFYSELKKRKTEELKIL
ncbi:hypothetical protein DH2020_013626 [Rehmannia glutinosa]|uniref:Myb-like protein L n=1 Tax=Rehmannia glutinosa TaxID=99300 RepID=A0ABR0X5X6_REHGL